MDELTVIEAGQENLPDETYVSGREGCQNCDTPPTEGQSYDSENEIAYAECDLDELRGEFPELVNIQSVGEKADEQRYEQLRKLGLSPREAYLATARRTIERDARSHLYSSAPRGASSPKGMTRWELGVARDIFSDLSDGEIHKLYQKVTK